MQPYELTEDAEQDLREVARYTLNQWGKEMLRQYRNGLKETFKAIAANDVPKRAFSKTFPNLMVTKYRYHYIFYLIDSLPKPVIIGVIHERRDTVSRLGERLA
ncbi:MAG: type II toxin-antitoxin system RelE/ParE family toxin [Candidatus Thiodiazotropha sp. (ex Epidulcina cf. delphinae)]|nr:type II toxin-antitoxin system RelE/ParE family toxin [Candidatus Thiodiazotropha sp. (ex Epidulcina cf. delphinae)]